MDLINQHLLENLPHLLSYKEVLENSQSNQDIFFFFKEFKKLRKQHAQCVELWNECMKMHAYLTPVHFLLGQAENFSAQISQQVKI